MDILKNGGTIIQHVYEAGAEILLVGEKIRIQPVSLLSEKLRCRLQQHREDVAQALKYYPVTLLMEAYRRAYFDYGYALDESVIIKLIPPSDWKYLSQCNEYDLEPQAKELALRAILHCGIVPRNWNSVLKCTACGWVFSPVPGESNSCPWCEVQAAGVSFPTPGLNRCANPETIDGCVVQECEVQNGKLEVVIHECFFCGERHLHGAGNDIWGRNVRTIDGIRHLGRRVRHCIREGIEINLPDGTLVCSNNGYYLGIGDQTAHGK